MAPNALSFHGNLSKIYVEYSFFNSFRFLGLNLNVLSPRGFPMYFVSNSGLNAPERLSRSSRMTSGLLIGLARGGLSAGQHIPTK